MTQYRWVRTEPLRLFLGYDSREPVAYHVLAHSILRRATVPVMIAPLVQDALRASGLYLRSRGATESTEFSLTRFLVPYLCGYRGHAVFLDSDMLCQVDIDVLWDEILAHSSAVLVAPHEFTPTASTKFLGQPQTAYPRKCWSSFMVFDNTRCTALTLPYVNAASGLELHRFAWLKDSDIGALPLDYGWLVGAYEANASARFLHYTDGGPWFAATRTCEHADLWFAERGRMLGADVQHAAVPA